jgi:hypothetical protein
MKKRPEDVGIDVVIPKAGPDVCYSIVVPAHNESASLRVLIEDLVWLMGELDGTCEVLISARNGSSIHGYPTLAEFRSSIGIDRRNDAIEGKGGRDDGCRPAASR